MRCALTRLMRRVVDDAVTMTHAPGAQTLCRLFVYVGEPNRRRPDPSTPPYTEAADGGSPVECQARAVTHASA